MCAYIDVVVLVSGAKVVNDAGLIVGRQVGHIGSAVIVGRVDRVEIESWYLLKLQERERD